MYKRDVHDKKFNITNRIIIPLTTYQQNKSEYFFNITNRKVELSEFSNLIILLLQQFLQSLKYIFYDSIYFL
jgi:hypothetical protein